MPTISRLRGRFFSVLIPVILVMVLLPVAEGAPKSLAPAPTLCQITEGLFGAKSGDDKKAAALSFAESAVGASDAILSKSIVDANKFREGLGTVIDGVVTCLNASVWAHK